MRPKLSPPAGARVAAAHPPGGARRASRRSRWRSTSPRSPPIAAASRLARARSCSSAQPATPGHGTGAFPSVTTLVRYTGLSERTVRTCLDRLEATGIIRPCDPGIVAARIKRAGRRPQDWDLNLGMVRYDRAKAGIVKLERQSPALPPGSRSWHDPDLTIRPAGAPTAPHARTGSSAPRPTAVTHCEGSSNIRARDRA